MIEANVEPLDSALRNLSRVAALGRKWVKDYRIINTALCTDCPNATILIERFVSVRDSLNEKWNELVAVVQATEPIEEPPPEV